jgi:competence protein ComEC
MTSVISNFRPRELWTGALPDLPAINNVLEHARAMNVTIRQFRAGDEFTWAGTNIRVLSPPRDYEINSKVSNNDSLALEVSYRNSAILLEGDAEKKMESLIVAQHPAATVLKVAHNGSITSTTPELLDAAKPQFALISVGERNTFGHPRPEILQRLSERRIVTYRTDQMGAVTFLMDGNGVRVETFAK